MTTSIHYRRRNKSPPFRFVDNLIPWDFLSVSRMRIIFVHSRPIIFDDRSSLYASEFSISIQRICTP